MTVLQTLEMALEALEAYLNATDSDQDVKAYDLMEKAVTVLRQQIALEKMAENARELGLDYEPADEPAGEIDSTGMAVIWANKPMNNAKLYTRPQPAANQAEKQQPYCYMDEYGNVEGEMKRYMEEEGGWFPVYTAPQKREWVGLTDEERNKLWRDVVKWGDPSHDDVDLMKAIEQALKEKNT